MAGSDHINPEPILYAAQGNRARPPDGGGP